MRIQHNIMAMNAYRNYNTNTKALSGNLEKLSSGYKINRAGDDAAGLAISEKMRAQITGLDAAQKNVKDGVSLVKTAEGAMQEIQDMLNRMDYLATQSANGTYDNDVDRANLNKEVNALKEEINRIADSANFNGIKLLDGSLDSNATVGVSSPKEVKLIEGSETIRQEGVSQAVTASFEIKLEGMVFAGSAGAGAAGTGALVMSVGGATVNLTVNGATTASFEMVSGGATVSVTANTSVNINGVTYNVEVATDGLTLKFTSNPASYDGLGVSASLDVSGIKAEIISNTLGDEVTVDSHWNTGAQNTVDGVKKKPQVEANVQFKMTADIIKSGQIKIGEHTYTFNDTKKLNASSGKEIGIKGYDLDNLSEKDINDITDKLVELAKTADGKLSLGHTNSTVTIQVNNSTSDNYTEGKFHDDATKVTEAGWSKGLVTFGKGETGKPGEALKLQIGDTADPFNQMAVEVGDMHVKAMGSTDKNGNVTSSIKDISIAKQSDAQAAVQVIRDAINYVSGVRGDLGAIQNRLEHTGNNLSVMAENIQDAESTIRDTDVADEMMKYVKNNILVQSAQAMLAQANQVPQGVLQLLG